MYVYLGERGDLFSCQMYYKTKILKLKFINGKEEDLNTDPCGSVRSLREWQLKAVRRAPLVLHYTVSRPLSGGQ